LRVGTRGPSRARLRGQSDPGRSPSRCTARTLGASARSAARLSSRFVFIALIRFSTVIFTFFSSSRSPRLRGFLPGRGSVNGPSPSRQAPSFGRAGWAPLRPEWGSRCLRIWALLGLFPRWSHYAPGILGFLALLGAFRHYAHYQTGPSGRSCGPLWGLSPPAWRRSGWGVAGWASGVIVLFDQA
jgi:hypothetical protein